MGAGCLFVAVWTLVAKLPLTVQAANRSTAFYGYITSSTSRYFTTGDTLDIPLSLQLAAVRLIPPRTRFAVAVPATTRAAAAEGVNPVTEEVIGAWLQYLLVPAQIVPDGEAEYVICYGCSASAWAHHVRWLWSDGHTQAIGEVVP